MNVPVKRTITQVKDGLAYKGDLSIAGTVFTYELNYSRPIQEWDDMPQLTDKEEIFKFFKITIKKDGEEINLDLDDSGWFFQMLVPFSVEFYNNPQTRQNNDGKLGDFVRGEDEVMSSCGASMAIGMETSVTWNAPDEAIQFLGSPKFGVQF